MKLVRREPPELGISFLDTITCGIGAIILLMTVTTARPMLSAEATEDPQAAQIGALQRELFAARDEAAAAQARVRERRAQKTLSDAELKEIKSQIAALLEAQNRAAKAAEQASLNAQIYGELKVAQQRLTEEMERLYAQKNRPQPKDLIGGIPIDSEYICFVIDTSGSMFNYAWQRMLEQMVETLTVYPQVKGLQVMNDQGSYMFPEYRGQWIPDTPARRLAVIERLKTWNPFSNSSPAEGIEAAIKQFYRPDRKIGLYVYGDEFTGKSIAEVAAFVRRLNRPSASGEPLVRIHAVGFPVQFAQPVHAQGTGIRFAALMRELTRQNGGSFVGLNSFR